MAPWVADGEADSVGEAAGAGDSVALVAGASVVAERAAVGDNLMRIVIPRESAVADDRGLSLSTLSRSEVF